MSAAAGPYSTRAQQREAALFGMGIFLATEILLFGGLFAAILYTRFAHPAAFVDASKELHLWIGAANTLLLLSSSFTAAVAVAAAKAGRGKTAAGLLLLTALLGVAFLCLKAVEYGTEFSEGMLPVAGGDHALGDSVMRLFMDLYLVATSLHAVHVTIGIGLLLWLGFRVGACRVALPERAVLVEVPILYWHLVDVIWVFLYPALYLAR